MSGMQEDASSAKDQQRDAYRLLSVLSKPLSNQGVTVLQNSRERRQKRRNFMQKKKRKNLKKVLTKGLECGRIYKSRDAEVAELADAHV